MSDKTQTEFEKKIQMLSDKKLEWAEFLLQFLSSDLHIMSKSENVSDVLVIEGEDGGHRVPVFTQSSMATPVVQNMPDYKYLLQVKIGDFVTGLKSGIGLVINPLSELPVELSPGQVDIIKEKLLHI